MNMKLALIAILSVFILQLTNAAVKVKVNEGDKILGVFWSPNKDAKIEIYKKGNFYFGISIWVATSRKDTNNPNKALQKREVLGIELLSNFRYKNNEYTDGTIYDPESGKTYNCKMSLTGNILKVRGYIGISLFGRTETFTRVVNN